MRLVVVLALILGGCARDAPPPPGRIMSINLCTDQLLLALLPRERIASVTWLARDAAYGALADKARLVRVNYGTAEEVMAAAPVLVLTGEFSAPTPKAMLRSAGYRLIEIAPANDFAGIRAATRQVGAAVGASARAEALIAAMDAKLARLAAMPPRQPMRVVTWDGGGSAAGEGTLTHAIVTAAGAHNVGATTGDGGFDAEALLVAAPDALIRSSPAFDRPDRRSEAAAHPAVARRWGTRTIEVDPARFGCGTPFAADAALSLRLALDGLSR